MTTEWWREKRDPDLVFLDYNQNARDHTIASAYSVRGNREGTVSTPITWEEVDDGRPARVHDRDGALARRARSATCTPGSTRRCSRSTRCWSGPIETSATRERARLIAALMGLLAFLILLAVLGLVVGALGRLLLPGPDPLGFFGTVGVGLLGSYSAGLFSWYVLHRHGAGLLLSVAFTVAILALLRMARGRGGYGRPS